MLWKVWLELSLGAIGCCEQNGALGVAPAIGWRHDGPEPRAQQCG
jgi:hypothetical protein